MAKEPTQNKLGELKTHLYSLRINLKLDIFMDQSSKRQIFANRSTKASPIFARLSLFFSRNL